MDDRQTPMANRTTQLPHWLPSRIENGLFYLILCVAVLCTTCALPARASDDVDPVGEAERSIAKLIPDCKALTGSPDTVIDLRDLFAKTAVGSDDPLEIEVVFNKKSKVATATIEQGELRLKWGKVGATEISVRASNPKTEKFVDVRFNAEVWQPDYGKLMMTVVGGLGIFLLGMKNMSEGLQAIAGAGLRRMISAVTDNRLMAASVGVLVTMLVQSSSITTVMVVGFVNSGFMNLSQAIGVIMGANIGTTITGWILALKIGKYGLPLLGFGAFGYLFVRKDRFRYIALAMMGLGMVFFGLELMKNGFGVIKELPDFEAWFARFDASTYLGVLKCAAVGCILTFIVQSSSATLGITIGLAAIDVIPFETAAALVLGENVGTTITAWLASIGATTNARRAAYFHVIFNLLGVAWVTAFFQDYIDCINYLLDLDSVRWLADIDSEAGDSLSVTVKIASVHTCFNVANTLLFLPFAGLLGTMLEHLVPQKDHKEKPHLTSLHVRMLETPVIAIEQSRAEVLRMGDSCNKMMGWLAQNTFQGEQDQKLIQKLFHREEVLDTIQDEVVAFLSDMLASNLPHEVIDEARLQLRMADEYESVSDYITSIMKFHLKLENQGHQFTPGMQLQLTKLHQKVADYLRMVTTGYEKREPEVITKAHSIGAEINHLVRQFRDDHLRRLTEKKVEPNVNVAFTSTLNSYRRVRDHTLNVAESLAGVK
jgi:phosphate:Na+ symporter